METSKKIRALIIDDEILAREKIRTLISKDKDFEIAGECKDAFDGLNKIKNLKPDLIFLDIQMPGMDGFEMLKSLKAKLKPVIIFTTAYDKYALKAFDYYALDYLLKPFDKERFQKSIDKAKVHLKNNSDDDTIKVLNLLEDIKLSKGLPEGKKYLQRMIIKSSGRIFFLKTEEINWIEASGNYLRIHVKDESHLIRETMNAIEKKLNPEIFVRIHRSVIVNIDCIKEIEPWFNGECVVYLKNGVKLNSSKSYKGNLLEIQN